MALTFVFPFPIFAQQPPTQTPDSAIPIFFFLHHTENTTLGILAVTPLDEKTLLWVYAPFPNNLYLASSTDTAHTLVAGPTAASGNGSSGLSDELSIGKNSGPNPFVWDGLIDDVRIWNTALSTSTLNTNWKTELQGNESNTA